jgi:hypothetical protein
MFKHDAVKMYGGVEIEQPAFLTSAIDRSGQLHTPIILSPDREALGSWVGSRAGMEAEVKRKISASDGNRNRIFQLTARPVKEISWPISK